MGHGRAAIVLERAEFGIDVKELARCGATAAAGVADQVMAYRAEVVSDIGGAIASMI